MNLFCSCLFGQLSQYIGIVAGPMHRSTKKGRAPDNAPDRQHRPGECPRSCPLRLTARYEQTTLNASPLVSQPKNARCQSLAFLSNTPTVIVSTHMHTAVGTHANINELDHSARNRAHIIRAQRTALALHRNQRETYPTPTANDDPAIPRRNATTSRFSSLVAARDQGHRNGDKEHQNGENDTASKAVSQHSYRNAHERAEQQMFTPHRLRDLSLHSSGGPFCKSYSFASNNLSVRLCGFPVFRGQPISPDAPCT